MRVASHHTPALYASVGLGLQPQLPSASPPLPWSRPLEAGEAAWCPPPPRGSSSLHCWKPCGWVKTWVSSDACTPRLLLLSPAQPSRCSPTGRTSVAHAVRETGEERREGTLRPPCRPIEEARVREESVSRERPVVPTSWQGSGELRSWGSA